MVLFPYLYGLVAPPEVCPPPWIHILGGQLLVVTIMTNLVSVSGDSMLVRMKVFSRSYLVIVCDNKPFTQLPAHVEALVERQATRRRGSAPRTIAMLLLLLYLFQPELT